MRQGTEKDYERAAEAYRHAQHQINPQAMFNLGYMYEHGLGLPFDPHLAKRYYDQAADVDPAAKLPVAFALASLWIRKNYAGSFLVSLPTPFFFYSPTFKRKKKDFFPLTQNPDLLRWPPLTVCSGQRDRFSSGALPPGGGVGGGGRPGRGQRHYIDPLRLPSHRPLPPRAAAPPRRRRRRS